MNEEALNTSGRKFLKKLGVTAQREIEMAVRDADAKGLLKGSDPLASSSSMPSVVLLAVKPDAYGLGCLSAECPASSTRRRLVQSVRRQRRWAGTWTRLPIEGRPRPTLRRSAIA
jgi:Family of unknown function (DUF6494)